MSTSKKEVQTIEELIDRYNNDFMFDAHQNESKIQRSIAGSELRRRGQNVLKLVAKKIESLFPKNKEIDYGLFMAWVCLIHSIIEVHKLPKPPYDRTVKFGNQDVNQWVNYCKLNG